MAQHKVLKPFGYSADGHTTRQTAAGEVLQDVSPAVLQGLLDEGFIVDITGEASSKLAGEAIATADHPNVDSNDAVHAEMADAKSRISDGKLGAPEAAQIVDEHKTDVMAEPAADADKSEKTDKKAKE